ncbi:IS4 family transposase [Pedobacter cryophilus]|uniref:IS4 family transposase n=1 Tax=Pedobacter cryophilus TaxID=2571271 RepID=A0A4U1C114_9SPHI|nr:IS4 family transposase [Pedobacter cryophilus]TKB98647.1 IS4 family transposase [Pedobacter cryophilus]
MEHIGHKPDFEGILGDKRLERRAEMISSSLLLSRSSIIHSATKSEAEQKGFYRFLGNESVKESDLIREMTQRCAKNTVGREVLVIQDSSSLGLSNNANIKPASGLGLVGNKVGLGFLTHVSLVLDANNESMLGFCDLQLWHRTKDKSNNTTKVYKTEPIEEKESYKWIKASNKAKATLAEATHITIIQDREGDIYEQFCLIPDHRTSLIIRSRDNRRLADGSKLYSVLKEAPVCGEYLLALPADLRKDKTKRVVEMEVRYQRVSIKKPTKGVTEGIIDEKELYAIEVKEKNNDSKDCICWRLLTDQVTLSLEEALMVVYRYKQRWYIEQLFRILKKQGFQIEDSQLETGWAIRKLFLMVLNSALRVMQLYLAYGKEDSQDLSEVFDHQEINCLEAIEKNHLNGTAKTSNPYPKNKLSWASWIIARLGGWKGNRKSQAAGPIIIKRGLDKFENIYQGWKLAAFKT